MLKIITHDKVEEWDVTVKSFKDCDVYYLNGYVSSFAAHGDGEPLLFYYTGDNGLRAVNVVMKRDIADDKRFAHRIEKGKYYDFITPYGYGGWIIEGADETSTAAMLEEYTQWCVDNGIVSEFVRLHPVLDNYKTVMAAYEVVMLGNTVALDLSSAETVWDNFTSKNRNTIRRAEKNGIKIYHGKSRELYETFRTIYDATMKRDNADEYYYFGDEFYSVICDKLKDNAEVFYAENADGLIIAASIILYCNDKLIYHLSGSVAEYRQLAPTNLLLYTAASWGCEHGFTSFHLGGGVGAKEDNLFRFKRAFYKGELRRFYIAKKIFDRSKYDMLLSLRDEKPSGNFFPEYRG